MSNTQSSSNIPCRFYNHDGCFRAETCRFSHQPDHKSVRDTRNKSVCKYYILGECRYETQCVYSHDRTYLDKDPSHWWNDPNPKGALKAASSSSPSGSGPSGSTQIPAQAHRNSNNKRGGSKFSERQRGKVRAGRKKAAPGGRQSLPEGIYVEDDGQMTNMGFSNDELNDLLSYGVKPWDGDAWDFLAALRGDY